jgi:hypothetical protein
VGYRRSSEAAGASPVALAETQPGESASIVPAVLAFPETTKASTGSAMAPLRIVFVLYTLGYLRFFDRVVQDLLDRGHEVHLVCERDYDRPSEQHWLAAMQDQPGFSHKTSDALARDRWSRVGKFLAGAADLAYFSSPAFADKRFLVRRARRRAPAIFRRFADSVIGRNERRRQLAWELLTALERALPPAERLELEITQESPDVLVLSPFLMPGKRHFEYIRAARRLGIPSCMCIASWDNLSSKARLRESPDRLIVWNDIQRREAVELHGIPEERVATTGAQSFDIWFDWTPRRRDEFCRRVGLDPEQRYLLYVGGSLYPETMTEAEYVHDVWLPELQRDPQLAELEILLRPHPYRLQQWAEQDWDLYPHVRVWPRDQAEMPLGEAARADYYDSIFHSEAVVGINTSAMIESAVVGRTVHTILAPEFEGSQTGTFHFDYLRAAGDGFLEAAHTYDEHRCQLLATVFGGRAEAETRRRRFLEQFVRPRGLDRPAVPIVVDSIESLAHVTPIPTPEPGRGLIPLRVLLYAALGVTMASRPRMVARRLRRVLAPRTRLRAALMRLNGTGSTSASA